MQFPHRIFSLPIFRRLQLTSRFLAIKPRGVLRPSILTSLIFASAVFAQTPVPAPVPPQVNPPPTGAPGVPPPPVVPAVPGATPANPNPAGVGAAEEMVPIQFINSDVREVIELLQRLTGRRYVMGNQPLGNVTIHISSGGVGKTEAIKLIEMHLMINGVVLSPSEDERIWKVSGAGINPKSVGIPFIDREELMPLNEQVVTYLFKLEWADPVELAQLIQGQILVQGPNQVMSVVALPKANALLVTENSALIRTLIRIVRAIDVRPAEVVSEFVTLEHAKAEDVVTALEKLFEKTQQGSATPNQPGQPPRVQRTITGPDGSPLPGQGNANIGGGEGNVSIEINGGASGIGPTEDNIVVGKVKITADKRTNRIHVVARPVALKVIKPLIKEYDVDVKLNTPAIRALKNRPVEEIMEALVSAIKDPGEREGGGTGGTTAGGTQRPQTNQNTANQNNGNNRFGGNAGLGGGGGTDIGESLSTGDRESKPLVQDLKNGTIIGDPLTNSIVVIGAADIKEKVFALIDQLDTRPQQVMIYTIIGELTLTDSEQYGMEYILRNGGLLSGAGTGTPAPGAASTAPLGFNDNGSAILNLNNLITQQNITRAITGGTSGLGGIVMAGNSIDAVLKALESTNRFRVVTRPSVFTKNNKKATITSGEEVPVPTSIQSQFNGGTNTGGLATNSSIQFKPIQLKLEVVPLINADGEVSMEIVQNISERSGTTRIDNNDIPNISQRAIKTNVSVPNNSTLILGGLIKESKSNDSGGINKLHNIPVVGWLFGKKSKTKTRTELVVMIRPVVTDGPLQAVQLREKHLEPMSIPPDLESAIYNANMRQTIPKAKVLRAAPAVRGGNVGLRK